MRRENELAEWVVRSEVDIETGGEDESREHLLSIPATEEKVTHAKISIQGLDRFSDEGVRILMSVSLQIGAGQIVGIIGPSGSGKSTILRAINRLWEPPSGTIFVDGEDITKQSVVSVRRRCGMLFQTPTLFDGTVAENIRYGPSLAGEKLTDKRVEELLKAADLDPTFGSKSVIGLSVGQAQRVALARTLANEPEILLLDEPTSALDPVSTKHIEESVLDLNRNRGLTVVFVSHSLEQVRRLADVVCLVANGEVLEVLKPSDLANATHPVVREYMAAAS
ncbi:UDP-glucose/iron transport system ATP-binding protein [Marchantia polymorpha subsp. ruderalis]|uniref:ABC transporter domain-containing protein n=2 Tax=Marchantia polymorpha TaxID=3197 RepID=A0AAF6BL83_MARPO|nr:hypothetical protein MARPO_0010s0182 [Marchantia polymorpha]BBN12767.1 hypothetical protein Mp_5g22730 [Marchantia polymorpha subsp. ruderalis]|eukprot:PTQ46811.1 hypothetical protein MARPO_0010s0182 [Marchantia polymorpha]